MPIVNFRRSSLRLPGVLVPASYARRRCRRSFCASSSKMVKRWVTGSARISRGNAWFAVAAGHLILLVHRITGGTGGSPRTRRCPPARASATAALAARVEAARAVVLAAVALDPPATSSPSCSRPSPSTGPTSAPRRRARGRHSRPGRRRAPRRRARGRPPRADRRQRLADVAQPLGGGLAVLNPPARTSRRRGRASRGTSARRCAGRSGAQGCSWRRRRGS